jgi:hypothetical protein
MGAGCPRTEVALVLDALGLETEAGRSAAPSRTRGGGQHAVFLFRAPAAGGLKGDLPFDALVKATYQLSYTLAIPLPRLDPGLQVLIEAMQARLAARPVVRVQKIAPGDLVEGRAMVPLNYCPRVLYPMGLITYDREGKVLSPGRVLCA